MNSRCCADRTFVARVERDRDGALWATLYVARAERTEFVLRRELVRSLRHGKRRAADMVLAQADASSSLTGVR